MNIFKKLSVLVAGFMGAAALFVGAPSASAQNWNHSSFFSDRVSSIVVSNTVSLTNLQSAIYGGTYASNVVGLIITNNTATKLVVTNGAAIENDNLLKDINLWVDRNGRGWPVMYYDSNNLAVAAIQANPANICIKLIGQSGANSAVNFIFTPLPNGVDESTASGDSFTVGVTANTTTQVCVYTNLPLWKWNGVGKLRLKSVTNTDTDATSNVTLLDVSVNGFSP